MNELIKVNYETDRPTVMGRELHEALGVETPYTIWFPRMAEYGFIENEDYVTILLDRSDGKAGKPRTDHQLTIDMAKEICMIQRSEKGKQFRQYFIEVEKQWNTPEAVMARALQFANNQLDSIKQQNLALTDTVNRQNEIMTAWKPKVLFAQAVETAKTSILIGDLAKILKQNGINVGQKRLFEWLRSNGYLIKTGSSFNMPTQRAMELKLFEVKESTVTNPDGSIRVTKTPKVTGRGQEYFINKFLGLAKDKPTIE
ncbi:MAG: phage antirepressor KilAC domain-containing protein [Oscillospiraceae bacterium]|nr:phage antirepressor KilAC domain-containing protein [Oscillospiraceae bacterium]